MLHYCSLPRRAFHYQRECRLSDRTRVRVSDYFHQMSLESRNLFRNTSHLINYIVNFKRLDGAYHHMKFNALKEIEKRDLKIDSI